MNDLPLDKLEHAATSHNPLLKTRLRPGLPEARIRQALRRAKITGPVDLLVSLYTWRDGTRLDTELALSKVGFFPSHAYYFVDLVYALSYLGFFKEAAKNQPKLAEAVGRYLPIFWDGSDRWIAIDLRLSGVIVTIDLHADRPFRHAYDSLHDFINDMIQANEKGTPLICFQR
jgi:hypothetical protein